MRKRVPERERPGALGDEYDLWCLAALIRTGVVVCRADTIPGKPPFAYELHLEMAYRRAGCPQGMKGSSVFCQPGGWSREIRKSHPQGAIRMGFHPGES